MGAIGETLARLGGLSVWMGEQQLKDVTPRIFARRPRLEGGKVVETNHPAFVFGHLAIYPAGLLGLVGGDASRAPKPAGFEELFAAGKACQDDPEGVIYPPMEVVTKAFFEGYRAALAELPSVPDARFAEPNPREQSRARFPTVHDAAAFYVTSHIMLHMGQVSAWRRCMGLGPVM